MNPTPPSGKTDMTKQISDLVAEIDALEAKATKGPWYDAGCCTVHGGPEGNPEDHEEIAHPMNCDNVPFIAALRNAWPQLRQALSAPQGWVKCSERLPDDEVSVLVYEPGRSVQKTCRWHHGWILPHKSNVTHWMPLPAAPSAGEGL